MTPATTPVRRGRLALLTIAVVLAAATIRAPLVSVGPVAHTIAHDLQVGAGVVGLLTTIPVLLFAVSSPLAVWLSRRFGAEFALTLCLAGVVIACLVRSAGGLGLALAGTALLGVAITIGNVIIPVIIAHEYPPHRVHLMTAVYTAAINIGATTAVVGTAPLAPSLGWQGALVVWGGFGIAALAVWAATHGIRATLGPARPVAADPDAPRAPSTLRSSTTWLLVVAFGCQSFGFFAVSAWLPTLLHDHGYPATISGDITGVFQLLGAAGALLVPVVIARANMVVGVAACMACWAVVPIGFLITPDLWWLWCVLGGIGQGAGITLVFSLIVGFGGGPRVVAARSGAVQGVGYAIGAVGPTFVGALHDATGEWTVPLLAILLMLAAFTVTGLIAARRLLVRDRAAA
jgi:CP family cyanate transporter-like MFS transporter